jgi:putative FmdB family regulatory protein
MPKYSFECDDCGHEFVLEMSIKEKEDQEVKCPECDSTKVSQQFGSFASAAGCSACSACSSCSGCGH